MYPQQQLPPNAPAGSVRKIWISALLPLGGILLFLIIVAFSLQDVEWIFDDGFFSVCVALQCLLTLGCWLYFSIALRERIRGNSMVILIIMYPIIQIGLQGALIFGGCLALVSVSGL